MMINGTVVKRFCSNLVATFCFVLPAVAKPQHDDQ